jgi:hypothetical protein
MPAAAPSSRPACATCGNHRAARRGFFDAAYPTIASACMVFP